MTRNHKLSSAILAILGGHAAVAIAASPGDDQPVASTRIEEIVVTAQRRTETIQNVPITMQALTGESLSQINVTTFDDAVRYLPNVQTTGSGPAQSNIIMRGLATGNTGTQGAGVVGSFPNVAVYLDEQSGQLPGRNLDIYAADLERIEILEGPQGTLFGAGAQAGVVRYITNKPKLDITEGAANGGYATTAHGAPSNNIDVAVNVPVIDDTLAFRAVVYNEARGGYISNIPSTFARAPTDRGIVDYFGGVVPPNTGPINNYNIAGDDSNPVTYKGYRFSALLKLNEAWDVLLMHAEQHIDSDGVFWQEAYDGTGKTLPDLSVELFNPTFNHDGFEDTQLTLSGKIDQLKLVYSGSYLTRNVNQQEDLTNYSRGVYADYYQCNYPGYPFVNGKPTTNSPGYCWSPSGYWNDQEHATHQSHELRLSTPDDWRMRALGGLFWENYTIHEETDWHYGSSPNFSPVGPPTIDPYTTPPSLLPATANNPNVRPAGDMFFDDITRGYRQKAAFASLDYDLLPKTLTLTVGTRYYRTENFELGSNVGSFGCEYGGPYNSGPPTPCVSTPQTGVLSNLNNLDAKHLNTTYSGFKSRANLTWRVTPDALVYYTWSQGFRPGGFNRAQSVIAPTSPIYGLFTPPLAYAPDTLINNELGWKTEWLDGRVQFNGAVYREDWKDTQITIFDPGITGNLIFTTNGPDYRVKGVETSVVARITNRLTINASAAWNSSEVSRTLNLVNSTTHQPINIVNPFGELGSPLAQCPPFQGNLRLRYELPLGTFTGFGQVGVARTGGSYASTDQLTKTLQGQSVAFYDPGFTTYDASFGVSKDTWTLTVYGQNLSDTRGDEFSSYNPFVKTETVNRPRTIGARIGVRFGERK